MAKRKKKEAAKSLASALKKKKTEKDSDKASDSSIKSGEQTQTDLQSLLKGVSEGKGFYRRQEKENSIEPKLAHDTKNEIAENYVMENVPISERKSTKKGHTPIDLPKDVKESKKSKDDVKEEIPEKLAKTPDKITKENIYLKLEQFFQDYMDGYHERYSRWESSISNILSILRKMRKYTKKNTEDLTETIQNLYNKIEGNLQQFKIKRDEIERIAGVDLLTMSGEFKKVLGLLELQIKEYRLKRLTDELLHEQNLYST
jgi:hypothetical protein